MLMTITIKGLKERIYTHHWLLEYRCENSAVESEHKQALEGYRFP